MKTDFAGEYYKSYIFDKYYLLKRKTVSTFEIFNKYWFNVY